MDTNDSEKAKEREGIPDQDDNGTVQDETKPYR